MKDYPQAKSPMILNFNLFLLLILSSFFTQDIFGKVTYKQKKVINKITKSIKIDHLKTELINYVSCCSPNRSVFTDGNKKAIEYLQGKLNAYAKNGKVDLQLFKPKVNYAIKMYQKDFDELIATRYKRGTKEYENWAGFNRSIKKELNNLADKNFQNIIYRKDHPSSKEVFLIYAHLDSIVYDKERLIIRKTQKSQAANDNATGVVTALEIIKYFDSLKLKKNLWIVFTNFQEIGFLGMKSFYDDYFLELSKKQNFQITNSMNLLMLGRDNKFLDKSKKNGNFKVYLPSDKPKSLITTQDFFDRAKGFSRGIDIAFVPNDFKFSDNVPLWDNDIPGFVLSYDWENDSNEKENHTPNDIIETINISSYTRLTQYIIAAIYLDIVEFSE